jgi:hypothetical protein
MAERVAKSLGTQPGESVTVAGSYDADHPLISPLTLGQLQRTVPCPFVNTPDSISVPSGRKT